MQPARTPSPRTDAAANIDRQLAREERARKARRNALLLVGALVAGVALIAAGVFARRGSAAASGAAATASPTTVAEAPTRAASANTAAPATPAATPTAVAPTEAALVPAPAPAPAPAQAGPNPTTAKPKVAKKTVAAAPAPAKTPTTQHLSIAIGTAGYEPSRLTASAGAPIILTVGKGEGCAAGFNIPALRVHLDNSAGAATVALGKLKAGTYQYVCSMGMVSGKLVVR